MEEKKDARESGISIEPEVQQQELRRGPSCLLESIPQEESRESGTQPYFIDHPQQAAIKEDETPSKRASLNDCKGGRVRSP